MSSSWRASSACERARESAMGLRSEAREGRWEEGLWVAVLECKPLGRAVVPQGQGCNENLVEIV